METIMRKYMVVFIVLGILAAGGTAWADTNTLTVTASVKGTCKFLTPTSTLNFGELDPGSPANVSKSTSVQFWCTKNVVGSSLSANDGLHWNGSHWGMLGPFDDVILYDLTLAPDVLENGGPNVTRTLGITGSIRADDYIGKSAGIYSDTVVITFSP
jgi:spore coat protein U-like protein